MSFRCFKSKSEIYELVNHDKSKRRSPTSVEDKSLYCSFKDSPIKDDEVLDLLPENSVQIYRSTSDLSLFRLPDSSNKVSRLAEKNLKFVSNISQIPEYNSTQSWSENTHFMDDSNCTMENLVDIWSRNGALSGSIDEPQRFISNLMSKKAFDVVKEPLRSLPREMSVKYGRDPAGYFVNDHDLSSKDRISQSHFHINKQNAAIKGLPPEKSYNDSIGGISIGPMTIVRGLENRNSGGSSSVATPNSPQQSPLSLCSSSGGKSSDNQLYEDGLSEEELRQIATRQQRHIQLQIDELRQKYLLLTHLKQPTEKKSKLPKINHSTMKLKDLFDQQEQMIVTLHSSKNQLTQSKILCNALKAEIGNLQNVWNSKRQELKMLESRNEEHRDYIKYVHQQTTSNVIPLDHEAFCRSKKLSTKNVQKSNTVHTPDQSSHYSQSVIGDPQTLSHPIQFPLEYGRMYVRHTHSSEQYSSPHYMFNNISDLSAFATHNAAYRTKLMDCTSSSRPPPLPAHAYQRANVLLSDRNQSLQLSEVNVSEYLHRDKRPPLPSYSTATRISANNKIAMLLSHARQGNAHTPTSSPPVLRRSSIVGLPYGKMPSRFASRNTINNVYIKKSSQESLERYKKTASEIYKAQLSKFKSSSTDDVRVDNNEVVPSAVKTAVDAEQSDVITHEEQLPSSPITDVMRSESLQHESGSICSSGSSLSLPDYLIENQTAHSVQTDDIVVSDVCVTVDKTVLENVSMIGEVEDLTDLLWDKSIIRALEALTKEPEKKILKKVSGNPSLSPNKRKAYFHPHSLLLDAALEAEFDLVKEMAGKVDDISKATDEGITALHNAVCSGREDIVKFLLDLGAHVNAGDTDGWTPLHCAASCNNLSMARLLVGYGASLFATSISDSEIPLQKCEADDDTECEHYLFAQQDLLGVSNDGKVYSLFQYDSTQDDELSMFPNQELRIIDKEPHNEPGWFQAVSISDSTKEGFVPKAFVSCYPLILPRKMAES